MMLVMLKLVNTLDPEKIYVESDYYIPIKIRFEHWANNDEPRHCWGTVSNDQKSLFEIAIGENTGKLKYITLVICSSYRIEASHQKFASSIPQIQGLPVFETQKWKRDDYYTKMVLNFDVYLSKPNISIILFPHEIEKIIYNDRVFFGFDKDDVLCSIEIKNLSIEEWKVLEESLGIKAYSEILSK